MPSRRRRKCCTGRRPSFHTIRHLKTSRPCLARRRCFAGSGTACCSRFCRPSGFSATSAIAGYILGKFRYRAFTIVFAIILATAIVPFEVYMIPLYFQVQALGILNSVWGMLVGYLVMSFGIFLIRQNVIHSIPDELLEAARIDGAGEFWIFFRIVLPLLRGALGALGVLAFFQAWTAFAWPLIVARPGQLHDRGRPCSVSDRLHRRSRTAERGLGVVLIPSITVFVLLRRNFVQGIASTGLKE